MASVRAETAASKGEGGGSLTNRGRSNWWDASAPFLPSEPLPSDTRVYCCIIGAGVTDLSTAYRLKKPDPGASVAVVEAEVAGFAANGRNAGQLIVQGAQHRAAFVPALQVVKTAQTLDGPISLTPDWIPHVGRARDPRVVYACGRWGNEMALGAHRVLMLGRKTADTNLWFVQREKLAWLNHLVTGLVSRTAIAQRRSRGRKISAAISIPFDLKIRPPRFGANLTNHTQT